jgi:hypothetical protein
MTIDGLQSDQLHRLAKLFIDTGEAVTVEDALQSLMRYRLGIYVDREAVGSPAYQASLLTIVNSGRRCFLGGVWLLGDLNIPLQIPWKNCLTLAEAVIDLQGHIVQEIDPSIPVICFGNKFLPGDLCEFSVQPVIRGWSGGVVPTNDFDDIRYDESFTPAGVLAGAIAVSEAFQFVRGDNALTGHRSPGLSLWNPSQSNNWLWADKGPKLEVLPSKIWLIGLGHLGQAYLWTLGFLPYKKTDDVLFVLQDTDQIGKANESTSLLTNPEIIGIPKTRAMAKWCEERGFQTALVERKFTEDFQINDNEPHLAICGVDNAQARASLEKVGFKRIIEAGLGKGTQEYLTFQIHTFPARNSAEHYWGNIAPTSNNLEQLIKQPAYRDLESNGLDRCGIIELAGRSVGSAFVGATVSTIAIAEALRLVIGENMDEVIDGDLRSSSILSCAIRNQLKLPLFNPGIVRIY